MEQHSLKLKLLDSFYDMVTTKKSNLPIYHGNDSKEFVPAYTAENKKVCNPLVADINLPSTHDFIRSLSEDKKVGLAGIAILKDGKLVAEHYVPPYGAGYQNHYRIRQKATTHVQWVAAFFYSTNFYNLIAYKHFFWRSHFFSGRLFFAYGGKPHCRSPPVRFET